MFLNRCLRGAVARAGPFVFVFATFGCGSGPVVVAPAVVEAEEQRLLRPFRAERTVVAETVELVLSPNFLGSRVGDMAIAQVGTAESSRVALPVLDKALHERRTIRGADGDVETFLNKLGGFERPLRLVVGGVQFQALQSVSVRVLPSGATMTLDVLARGDVTVLAGSQRTDMPQFEIRDGLWRGQ